MGFGVPIAAWLRGPLRAWASDLLTRRILERSQLLAPEPIERALAEHLSGRADRTQQLWTALMFVSWFDAKLSD
jgi:asparagine synthase (glutamine-hydrolysing)